MSHSEKFATPAVPAGAAVLTTPSTTVAPVRPFSTPLDVRALLTTAAPPLDHVLPGLLAGSVGMLAGPGGVGKSMLELQLAVALATGTPACGGLFAELMPPSAPARVVLVTAEESALVLQHRLQAIACALFDAPERFGIRLAFDAFVALLADNLRLFDSAPHPYALLDRDFSPTGVLHDLTEACVGARLVLIDPLRQFHDGEENDSAAMNRLVQTLHRLAMDTGAAVVFVHHTSKAATYAGQGDTAGAARGSSALTDGVRWQANLSHLSAEKAKVISVPDAAPGHLLLLDVAKSNYLAPQPTQVLERLRGGVFARCNTASPLPGALKSRGNPRPSQGKRTGSRP